MTKKQIKKDLTGIIKWPPPGYPRRTKDGYPTEFAYDEFAYRRMINSYREALKELVKKIK